MDTTQRPKSSSGKKTTAPKGKARKRGVKSRMKARTKRAAASSIIMSVPGTVPIFKVTGLPRYTGIAKHLYAQSIPPVSPATATAIASTLGISRHKLLVAQKRISKLGGASGLMRDSK